MRGEGNHKIPGSFAPENMEKTGAERVKYSLACQHEDAIPIKFVSYVQKCPIVLCTFAVALRKESVDRNVNTDDALGGIVDSIMQGDNALAKSIFKGFAQFDENDWARLRDLIDKFLAGAVPAEIMERYMDDAALQRMEDGLGKNNAAFMYGYAVGLGEREKKEKDGDQ